jgi:hypothetical protein
MDGWMDDRKLLHLARANLSYFSRRDKMQHIDRGANVWLLQLTSVAYYSELPNLLTDTPCIIHIFTVL